MARCSSDVLTSPNLLTALPGVAFVVGNKHGGAEVAEFRARRRTRCARRRTPHAQTHTHATFFLFYKHAVTTAHGRASDRTEAVTATRKDEVGGAGNILKEPAEPSGASRRRHGVVAML